ncbi:MAG: hypothetical protein HN348_25275 [Proteobacteria bacterium]|jgi:hypothetical protein|nr:hypothetical protein [Pseudomonadota bacterium]
MRGLLEHTKKDVRYTCCSELKRQAAQLDWSPVLLGVVANLAHASEYARDQAARALGAFVQRGPVEAEMVVELLASAGVSDEVKAKIVG